MSSSLSGSLPNNHGPFRSFRDLRGLSLGHRGQACRFPRAGLGRASNLVADPPADTAAATDDARAGGGCSALHVVVEGGEPHGPLQVLPEMRVARRDERLRDGFYGTARTGRRLGAGRGWEWICTGSNPTEALKGRIFQPAAGDGSF